MSHLCIKGFCGVFLGALVVKNPPANAGDMGSIPDGGRSHMPWSNWACAPQLFEPVLYSPGAATSEPTCGNYWSYIPRARALQQNHYNEKFTTIRESPYSQIN